MSRTPPPESLGYQTRDADPREFGRIAAQGRADIVSTLHSVADGVVYDLDPGRFPAMPQWDGHPPFTITTYRSPHGERVQNDLVLFEPSRNHRGFRFLSELVVTGMHLGAHIDALCHAVVDGGWHGGFRADEEIGDFGALRSDAATIPPIITNGVLFDVAGHRGVEHLPPGDAIEAQELADLAAARHLSPIDGGAVLLRTGAMTRWPDARAYEKVAGAGIDLDAARWLVEEFGAALVGADTPAVEQQPSADLDNPHPVHSYLLRDCGVHQLEYLWLEQLARDARTRFAFICLPLKITGATASMVRPVAIA